MAKTILDFEKPIVELEAKLEEMRKFSDDLDIDRSAHSGFQFAADISDQDHDRECRYV